MGRRPLRPDEVSNYRPPSNRLPMVGVYLSEPAFSALRQRAIRWGYIKADSQKARGLAAYLRSLAHHSQTWEDTRHPSLIAASTLLLDPTLDAERRQSERTPTYAFDPSLPLSRTKAGLKYALWWDPEDRTPRIKRVFVAEQFPLDYFATLALTWGITDPYHSEFQMSPTTRAANALEAFARGSLTPSIETYNPTPPTREYVRRRHYKEIAW